MDAHIEALQTATPKWEKGYSGEDSPQHVLTTAQVLDIYTSTESRAVVARRHDVSVSTVSMIRNGKRWAWLTSRVQDGAA